MHEGRDRKVANNCDNCDKDRTKSFNKMSYDISLKSIRYGRSVMFLFTIFIISTHFQSNQLIINCQQTTQVSQTQSPTTSSNPSKQTTNSDLISQQTKPPPKLQPQTSISNNNNNNYNSNGKFN